MDILGFVREHNSSLGLGSLYAKVCKSYLSTIKFLGERARHMIPWLFLHSKGIHSTTWKLHVDKSEYLTCVTWVYTQTHTVALLNSALKRGGGGKTKQNPNAIKIKFT